MTESCPVESGEPRDERLLAARLRELPPSESSSRLLSLIEMIKVDLQQQWQQGRQVLLESYFEAIPELGSLEALPADLILAEVEARCLSGAPVDWIEFERRFPGQAEALRQRFGQSQDSSASTVLELFAKATAQPPSAPPPLARVRKAPISLPEQFGRYRIIKRLGRGAMGSVYLAHDAQLDRRVAVKVPHFRTEGPAQSPNGHDLDRFYCEARAAATIDHPNLCPVYDVGQIDGIHYLSMAYVRGRPLSDYIDPERPMPPRRVAAVVRKLALALEVAHARGVVHRDLKPANIMINQRREPVIMDFGLAWRIGSTDQRLTRTGVVLGTPAYMSPEQASGRMEVLGPRCDIYSLGVIMYQMLTACVPFDGPDAAILGQILFVEAVPPSGHRPDLDPQIEAICLKAMAKKAQDRYATMGELAGALGDYLHNGAPPASPAYTAGPSEVPEEAIADHPEADESGPLIPPLQPEYLAECGPAQVGEIEPSGEAATPPDFRGSWHRWNSIVELFAYRRSRFHVDWPEYDKLHKELIAACRARAEATDGVNRTVYRRLEDFIRPWLTPKALAQADRAILCSLLLCCRQAYQELDDPPPDSPLPDDGPSTRATWVRAVALALGVAVALLVLLIQIAG